MSGTDCFMREKARNIGCFNPPRSDIILDCRTIQSQLLSRSRKCFKICLSVATDMETVEAQDMLFSIFSPTWKFPYPCLSVPVFKETNEM